MNELEISRTPELIGAEIRTLTTQAQTITLWFGIEIGRRLVEAKELCAHGEWLPFLEKETAFSQPTASRYMRLYTEYGAEQSSLFGAEPKYSMLNNLSVSNALRLLALPEDEREEFAVENDMEHLSTSRVDELVKARMAEIEAERQKDALALASAEGRVKVLENELTASGEELKKARGQIAALEAQPVATVEVRDEEAIKAAAEGARADAQKEFQQILTDAEKKVKEQETELKKALEEVEALRRDKKQLESAAATKGTIDKLNAQYEQRIKEAEAKAAEAEKQLKLAAPGMAEFSAAFTRAQQELTAMETALGKVSDEEVAAKLRTAATAVLDKFRPVFKGAEA